MSTSGESIDYPDTSPDQRSKDTRLSFDEYTNSGTEENYPSCLTTRNKVYTKVNSTPRKNRVVAENDPQVTHPTAKATTNTNGDGVQATTVSNRFVMLPIQEVQEEEIQQDINNEHPTDQGRQQPPQPTNSTGNGRPPAIVLHEKINNTNEIKNALIQIASKGFNLKHTANSTTVQLTDRNQAAEVSKWLEQRGQESRFCNRRNR